MLPAGVERRRDAACLLALALACVALRGPGLRAGDLNMDESAYQATASFLLGSGKSAFSLFNMGPTSAVYQAAAALFGPYTMLPLRVLGLLICWASASLLYSMVGRATSRVAGLASALVLVHLAQFFEGPSVNREWFSVIFLLAGCSAAWRARDEPGPVRDRWLALAGAGCAASLWFKEQTLPIVLAIPIFLVADARLRPAASRLLRDLGLYAAGGACVLLAYAALLWWNGGLHEYLAFNRRFFAGYVQANEAAALGERSGGLYFRAFLSLLPGRAFFAIGYCTAACSALYAAHALLRRRAPGEPERALLRLGLLFGAYLATAMLSVRMGNRFFGHYYLLMLPAVAALFGVAAHALVRRSGSASPAVAVARALLLAVLVLEIGPARPMLLGVDPQMAAASPLLLQTLGWPGGLAVAALLAGLGLVGSRLSLLRPMAAAVLLASVMLLVVQSHRLKPQRPFWFGDEPGLTRELNARRGLGDRLFVWGWAPWIYSLSRLEAASEITLPNIVVNDYSRRPPSPRIEPRYAAILMRDLRERTPRFIVDATEVSITLADGGPFLYRLELYPDFELSGLLRERYELAGRFDGCALYVLTRP